MFRDLKEYRQIQSIYENQVWISDEEKQLKACLDEQNFTEDEINYIYDNFDNNFDALTQELVREFIEDYEILSEETLSEEELIEYVGATLKVGKAMLKGFKYAPKTLNQFGKQSKGIARGLEKLSSAFGAGKKSVARIADAGGAKSASVVRKNLGKLTTGVGNFFKGKGKKVVVPPLPKGTGTVAAAGAAGLGGGFIGGKLAQNPNAATKDDIKALADKIKKSGVTSPAANVPSKPPEPPKIEAPKSPEDAGKKAADAGKKGGTTFGDAIKLNTPKPQSTVIQNTMKDGGKKVEKKAPPTSSKPKKMGEIERQNRE